MQSLVTPLFADVLSVIILQDRTIKFYINGQNVRTAKTAIPARPEQIPRPALCGAHS